MLDALADQPMMVIGLERACSAAGDLKAEVAIHAERLATEAAITGHAHTARMASIPGWCWVTKSFKPAAEALGRVQ